MVTRARVSSLFLGLMLFGFTGATSVVAQLGPTPGTTTTTTSPTTTATTAVTNTTNAATSTVTTTTSTATSSTTSPTTSATNASPTTTSTPSTTPSQPMATLIEYDLPAEGDSQPGAVAVDKNNGLWFVTRDGTTRVLRIQPPGLATGNQAAQWTSWDLNAAFFNNGIRRVKQTEDQTSVFVRSLSSIQQVKTKDCTTTSSTTTCTLIAYMDGNFGMVSDITLDSSNNAITAVSTSPSTQAFDPALSFIEQLVPRVFADPNNPTQLLATVTRWQVGGGAGNCISDISNPCIAGITTHPWNSNLVYFSAPGGCDPTAIAAGNDPMDPGVAACLATNNIGELNLSTDTLRFWSLTAAFASDPQGPVYQPRQLRFDEDGDLWVTTGSGDLVSLDPNRNILTRHSVPPGASLAFSNDLFGVAPDGGFVGYTAADLNKVGMLIPQGYGVECSQDNNCLSSGTCNAASNPPCETTFNIPVQVSQTPKNSDWTKPYRATVSATVMSKGDGTYVEADISTDHNPNGSSMTPLGITPHPGKAVGTYFVAVGNASNKLIDRVAIVRMPRAHLKGKHEREDKDSNDDGTGQDDEDHDGIPNQHKDSNSKAKMERHNEALAPGQSRDYNMTTGSSTMAIVAALQSDVALEPVSVQIIDPTGITLATPVPTPGLAVATVVPTAPGNYTIRVKNEGAVPINPETQLITREPLSLP